MPLVGPDEPRYAQVTREMFEHHDFITPTLGGHTWFEKPALLYWLMMTNYALFGVSEWSARAGAAAFGILTIMLTGWLGAHVERANPDDGLSGFGLLSAAALASSAGLIVFSRAASFDILVTATITASLALFFVAEIEGDKRRRTALLAGFYAAMGLALLAKGLIGVVLPCGIVGVYFLLRREWPSRAFLRSVWWGALLTVAVASVWYAPVIRQHGWSFIEEFFVQHHFARYVSDKYHHPQPFYFYVPVMALFALPWTCFLAVALWNARWWSWRALTVKDKLRVFALAWTLAPILFFSLSGSKLPGYILPALPGAALLIGECLVCFINRKSDLRHIMRATGGLVLLIGASAAVYMTLNGQVPWITVVIVLAPVFLAGALSLTKPHLRRACVASIVGASLIVALLAAQLVAAQFARAQSMRDLLHLAATRGYSSVPVFNLHTIERTSEFYAAGRTLYDAQGELVKFEGVNELTDAARRAGGTVLVIVLVEYVGQLTEHAPIEAEILGTNGEVALVAVRVRGDD